MTGDDSTPRGAIRGTTAKQFACPACGGQVTVYAYGQSLSASCVHCQTIIDVTDPSLHILQNYKNNTNHIDSAIKLGSIGHFQDTNWMCIGILLQTDSTGYWNWHEHLLFNAEKGFRWLVENRGHWTLFKKTKYKPKVIPGGINVYAKDYQHYTSDSSQVLCALGEFNWRVSVGEKAKIRDFINPPEMVSESRVERESNWQVGEYLLPEQVQTAFKLKDALPRPRGIAPHQPSPHKPLFQSLWKKAAILIGLLTFCQILFSCAAKNSFVMQETFTADRTKKGVSQQFVTQPFAIRDGSSNLEITSHAAVHNNWIAVGLTLVNVDTNQAFQLEQEVSFYSGYDSDGRWSEGSQVSETLLPDIPDGKYILNIDVKNLETVGPPVLNISINRGVFFMANYWLGLGLLLTFPLFSTFRHRTFETARWEDSEVGNSE